MLKCVLYPHTAVRVRVCAYLHACMCVIVFLFVQVVYALLAGQLPVVVLIVFISLLPVMMAALAGACVCVCERVCERVCVCVYIYICFYICVRVRSQ